MGYAAKKFDEIDWHTRHSKRIKSEMRDFLKKRLWTHAVTLAFNDPDYKPERMRERLKAWDGRVNRIMLGGRWLKKPDERMFWIAFIEKKDTNPHYHLLLCLLEGQEDRFDLGIEWMASDVWTKLVPHGTVKIQRIKLDEKNGAVHYVTKELDKKGRLEYNVCSREFCS